MPHFHKFQSALAWVFPSPPLSGGGGISGHTSCKVHCKGRQKVGVGGRGRHCFSRTSKNAFFRPFLTFFPKNVQNLIDSSKPSRFFSILKFFGEIWEKILNSTTVNGHQATLLRVLLILLLEHNINRFHYNKSCTARRHELQDWTHLQLSVKKDCEKKRELTRYSISNASRFSRHRDLSSLSRRARLCFLLSSSSSLMRCSPCLDRLITC